MTSAPLIEGLSDIVDRYDAFILDIFGVIHDGLRPFPETIQTLEFLKDAGKKTCLLSNTPRRASGAAAQMESMGISRSLYDHIVTSGETTHAALREEKGKSCWFIAPASHNEILEGLNLDVVDRPDKADFILNSIPGTEPSAIEVLKEQLAIAAQTNIPMICANPDLVVNIGDQQYECAGTFAAFYEEIGGHVVYHGKPHAPVYEQCFEKLGKPEKSKVLAIGDSLHTDITGAQNFGIDSCFNLVGIHWEEVQLDHAPGEADLAKIKKMIEGQSHKPTYVMAGFQW